MDKLWSALKMEKSQTDERNSETIPKPGENLPSVENINTQSEFKIRSNAAIKEEKGFCTGFDLMCCPCLHCHD